MHRTSLGPWTAVAGNAHPPDMGQEQVQMSPPGRLDDPGRMLFAIFFVAVYFPCVYDGHYHRITGAFVGEYRLAG